MGGFLLRRLLLAIPTLVLVAVIVFLMIRLIPGDPAQVILGDHADPESIAVTRARLGLDQPLPIQFFLWLRAVLHGDLGISIVNRQPVLPLIWDRFQLSAGIILLSIALAASIAIPAGLFAAWRHNRLADLLTVVAATIGLSMPSFWIGLLLLWLFGMKLGWLPVVGYVSLSEDPSRALSFLVMPVLTLVIVEVGVLIRMARASTIEVLRLEYITHARAKGLSERRVLLRHALPNAFAPTLTLIGMVTGTLLGGIAVVETVFTLPGLGRLLVESIYARDYPVIQGCLLVISVAYVLLNLIVDALQPVFDPRVVLS